MTPREQQLVDALRGVLSALRSSEAKFDALDRACELADAAIAEAETSPGPERLRRMFPMGAVRR